MDEQQTEKSTRNKSTKEDQGDNEKIPIIQRYGGHDHIQSKGGLMAVMDIEFIYLSEILSDEQIKEIEDKFSGCRLYIPRKNPEYARQREMFNQKIEAGYTREDAMRSVAKAFDRSMRTIRDHLIKGI